MPTYNVTGSPAGYSCALNGAQSVVFAVPSGTLASGSWYETHDPPSSIGVNPDYSLNTGGGTTLESAGGILSGAQIADLQAAAGGNLTTTVTAINQNGINVTVVLILNFVDTSIPAPPASLNLPVAPAPTPVITGGGKQDADCTEGVHQLLQGASVNSVLPWAFAWFAESRYFISIGGRTFSVDLMTGLDSSGAITNAGYGYVASAAVATIPGYPETVFMTPTNAYTNPTTPLFGSRGTTVYSSHNMSTMNDAGVSAPFDKTVTFRPFDGDGPARERLKQCIRVKLFGDYTDYPDHSSIGKISLKTNTGYIETYDIFPAQLSGFDSYPAIPRVYDPGLIAEQEFVQAIGNLLEVTVTFTVTCVSITNVMMEYIVLDGAPTGVLASGG